ncbi:MAG: hypothetical protein IKB99_00165 [Lentisphaeria bacterium]|nr:hypothetical protein [Lentisphaeria bacterium]
MREAVFEFQFLTPALLAGADQQTAEMRIPSLRGALRWWTRLLYGDDYENEVFGYVKGKECVPSTVKFRLLNDSMGKIIKSQNAQSLTKNEFDYFLWPLRRDNTRGILDADYRIKVAMSIKPGCEEIEDGILKSFLLFGSLGTRSRRAYGSVWPLSVTIDGEQWKIPQTVDELLDESDNFFGDAEISIWQLSSGVRDYKEAVNVCTTFLKTLRCGKSQYGVAASEWGKADHDTGLNLKENSKNYRAGLGLPLVQQYSKSRKKVKYSFNGCDRLASPLHFKVIKLKEGYVPIMLVIPEYVPADGTILTAETNDNRFYRVKLDRILLDGLAKKAGFVQKIYPDAEMLVRYPYEEE